MDAIVTQCQGQKLTKDNTLKQYFLIQSLQLYEYKVTCVSAYDFKVLQRKSQGSAKAFF